VLCKVAPAVSDVHIEDVHRAGGIMGILGELDRAGLIHGECSTVHAETMAGALARWDIKRSNSETVQTFFKAAPGSLLAAGEQKTGLKARGMEMFPWDPRSGNKAEKPLPAPF
jgi:dihydroxyacid dehydratase/phosphogluconate dehydratase